MLSVYKNCRQKLDYICSVGHRHSISYGEWKHQGNRCFYCGVKTCSTKRLVNIDRIRKSFENEGYILLSNVYAGSKAKLKYQCPFGHINEISWNNWSRGWRCPTCKYINHSVNQSGVLNHQWKGGISCAPYCSDWTKEYKEFIKSRDGYICLNPGCYKEDNMLSVHHIDYDKLNCSFSNLITLCRSCNSRANKDREWHKAWYQSILTKRYGYTY